MKNLHKLLIVLISVAFLASGALAQSDASPKVKNQMEKKVKSSNPGMDLQSMGGAEKAPTSMEQMQQAFPDRDISEAFWPQDRDINAKNTPIPSDALFDLQFEWPVGVGGGEAGIETNGTYIYTTKWNGTGEYYRYGMDGTYIEQLTVAGAAGTRDLAYDGTYFYGSAATTTVFQLDLDNASLISTFTAPTDCRAIAYNEDDDAFYANNWGTDITKFDMAGTNLGSFPVGPVGDSYYGFAYDNYCSGAYLWGYAQVGTNLSEIIQMSLPDGAETGVTFDVGSVLSAVASAGGMCIDDNLVSGFWTIMGTCQNVNIWGLELCTSGPALTNDVGIQSISEPNTGPDLTSTEPVTVIVKNYGTDPQSNFDVWFTLDGGTAVTETISATINGGDTYTHTFAVTVDLSAYGSYEFESCTDLTGDENPGNDCKIKTVENLAPSLCFPTYSSGCVVGDGFTDFAVEQIQNYDNGCEDNTGLTGCSQYFGLGPAMLFPGVTHTFTMACGYSSQHANIWIDFNDDLILDADEMILFDYVLESVGVLYDVDITIPAAAQTGLHVMRVMAVWITTFTDPCGSYSYGESEDYMVFVGVAEYGILNGTVTENTGGAPIDGALISVANGQYTTTTIADGTYEILDVLAGDWDISCTADGYNPAASTVTITNGGTTTEDFAMLAPTMEIDPLAINIVIDPNTQDVDYIDITNNGDGALHWTGQLEMLTASDDLFDLIWEVPVGVGGGEAGIETNGTYIYTTKWNGTGEYYRYGMDGTYIEQITVAGAAATRDLAYDGTYFYGGPATSTVFELDLDNATLISTISAPTDCRAIAYNENDDAFYANNWGTDITKFDKTGTNLGSFPVGPVGDSYYGFAYDNYTPGAPYLWGYAQVGASLSELIQIQLPSGVETGLTFDVGSVLSASDMAGGMCIDNNISAGLWAFLGTCQNVNLWALELGPAGPVWISIDPTSGDVDPGMSDQMTVSFDATDIVPGTVKTANIHFYSDPDVGMVTVPVTMTVGDQLNGFIEGNVTLDGSAPYNIGDVTEVLVEAGPYSAFPDASGDYQIEAYPGTYDVVATLYGYETQTVPGIVVGAGATVTGIDFTLPILYGRIMGTVTDEVTGDPIENATVSVIDTDFEAMTAADGTYEIIIEAGTYDVMANHPTYMAEVAQDVDVFAEADTQLDFELQFQIQCEFSVVLWDDYGDGWNGGTLTISVDGTVVLNNITIVTGFGPETFYFDVGSGAEITCTYVGSGWPYENYYYIYDNDGNEVFADGLGGIEPTGGTFIGTCIVFIYGDLAGTVTESGSGNPIEGAEVMIDDMTDVTLADGTYLIEDVMIGTWDVYCNAVGYNPAVATGVVILEEEVTIQDFVLDAPEFIVDPLIVNVTLEPNQLLQEVVTLENPGNGAIDWSAAVIVLEDDATDDMFDLIWEVPVGVGGGEAGIETNGTYIYTTKWNGTGEYYRYGMDGSYIEQFTISGAAATRDLAYDGTYFYGGPATSTVFELDLDNATLVSTISAPTDCRAIGFNHDDNTFYANNWGTAITKFDYTGANLGSFPVGPFGDSYYGFAYDNSEGTPYLWGYAQVGANLSEIIQIELPDGTETGLTFDVGTVLSAVDMAGGMCIDDHISPGLWAFLGTCQNVNLWALELGPAGPVWLTIDPVSGTLDPLATQDMDLYFDATDLLPGVYEAEIHFSTDPNVGEPIVAVTMTVEGLIPAINLIAVYNCTDVDLTWEMPTGGNPDSWNVYRDDVLIGDATVMSYTDEMVDPEVEYAYTVKAVYAGEESQPTAPTLIIVPTPDDLEALDLEAIADLPNENDVTLTWSEPAACLAPDSYSIYRDNAMIADGVTGLEYVDESLPGGFYEYYVIAVYYFGDSEASEPAYVLITGIEDYDASLFQIFPNPATELVNVSSPVEITRIHVLNNKGQLVLDEEVNNMEYQINVSKYEAGIYFIKLETSEGTILRKVAVK